MSLAKDAVWLMPLPIFPRAGCGIAGDFDTPEMTKFENVQKRTWETCASERGRVKSAERARE